MRFLHYPLKKEHAYSPQRRRSSIAMPDTIASKHPRPNSGEKISKPVIEFICLLINNIPDLTDEQIRICFDPFPEFHPL